MKAKRPELTTVMTQRDIEIVENYMDALEAENQRLREALNYATHDLDPEDVIVIRQIVGDDAFLRRMEARDE